MTLSVIRKYPKLISDAGEFGGVIEIVLILVVFFYGFYNDNFMEREQKEALLVYPEEIYNYLYELDTFNEKRKLEKIIDSRLMKLDDFFNLMQLNTNMEIFFAMFLKPFHIKLLPLVLVNMEKDRLIMLKENKPEREIPPCKF